MRADRLDRGMQLIPQLSEVMEDGADERIRSIYEDVRATLRVPFVNFIFRVLANYPAYLLSAWNRLSPLFRRVAFERAADELRAQALLEPVPEVRAEDLGRADELRRIRAFTDTIHYVLPKLLLVATAFDEALERDALAERSGSGSAEASSVEIPLGAAKGTSVVPMVASDQATDETRAIFEDIKERHGHPGVASYYRGLANWPEFLEALWNRISPLVGSVAYEERKRQLIEQASGTIRELAGSSGAHAVGPPKVDGEQVAEIRCILAVFRLRIIPDLLLDVSLIKAALDGPEAARSSRFSVAE